MPPFTDKIAYICYHGRCFKAEDYYDYSKGKLSVRSSDAEMDKDANGIISDQSGIGTDEAGNQIDMGGNDMAGVSEEEALRYKEIIFGFYHKLPMRLRRNIQIIIDDPDSGKTKVKTEDLHERAGKIWSDAVHSLEESWGQALTAQDKLLPSIRISPNSNGSSHVSVSDANNRIDVLLTEVEKGTLRHEATHAAFDILAMKHGVELVYGGENYPYWFAEGVAHYEESKYYDVGELSLDYDALCVWGPDGFESFRIGSGWEDTDRIEARLAITYLVRHCEDGHKKYRKLIDIITRVDQPFEASFMEAVGIPLGDFTRDANEWIRETLSSVHVINGAGGVSDDDDVWNSGKAVCSRVLIDGQVAGAQIIINEEYGYSTDVYSAKGLLIFTYDYDSELDLFHERIYIYKDNGVSEIHEYENGEFSCVSILFNGRMIERRGWLYDADNGGAEQSIRAEDGSFSETRYYTDVGDLWDLSGIPVRYARYFHKIEERGTAAIFLPPYRYDDYEYVDGVAVKRGILYNEGAAQTISDYSLIRMFDTKPYVFNDMSIEAGDTRIEIDFYPEYFSGEEIKCENCTGFGFDRNILNSGRVREIRVFRNDVPVFMGSYDESNQAPVYEYWCNDDLEDGRRHIWTIEDEPDMRSFFVFDEHGMPIAEIIFAAERTRIVYK